MSESFFEEEYPPLLPPGLHHMSLRELRDRCVAAFPHSWSRRTIMELLEGVLARLEAAGGAGDLWIGGSFVTEKEEPDDVY